MRIAVIGAGISGMSSAYFLSKNHDVHLYEVNDRLGGHARTLNVDIDGENINVDTGFIVFNNWNYPNILGLFKEIGVPYQDSDMSFGVSIDDGWLEYGSSDMFAQKRNFLRPAYWAMLADIVRFNKHAPRYIERDINITMQECLDELKMGEWFRRYYLLAMGAAIWSCPIESIMRFPAKTFLSFFKNHGLLNIVKRPQWYTVTGGSREYVHRLIKGFKDKIRLSSAVTKVQKQGEQWCVNGEAFDQVIFACHADDAIEILEDPEPYQDIIGAFDYQENHIIVHSDTSFMPKEKKCWASWVYLSEGREDKNNAVSLSYWMNNLQGQNTQEPLIVTLNPGRKPKEDLILDEHYFKHPIFDVKAIKAQEKIRDIQGKDGVWFCGAYQRYGFHEDGLWSAVNIAKSMGVDIPWN